jgi:hypothetical protein
VPQRLLTIWLLTLVVACGRTGLDSESFEAARDAGSDLGLDADALPPLSCERYANPLDVTSTFDASPYCWRDRGCVPVIYLAEYVDYLPYIERALAAWEAESCSDLCFGEPESVDVIPNDRDGRISFGRWIVAPEDSYLRRRPLAGFSFDVRDDRITGAHVGWERALVPADLDCIQPMMTRAVGLAVGLEDSIVPDPSLLGFGVTSISPRDREAFCDKYGPGGVCLR